MKHSKKLLSLLLALILSFSLTACGGDFEAAVETAGEIIEVVDQVAQTVESFEDTGESDTVQTEAEPIIESTDAPVEPEQEIAEEAAAPAIDEDGWYYSKDDVALYIHTFGRLPDNYITKNEARDLGWEGGSVERYLEGAAIGGDRFGNYEGLLPKGHNYTECDIDTNGQSSRGAKRIIFSDDGLIYYTDDHYESFELLYGEE
ncbi:MAG: ribonuclease [Ruminococcaceae bacterium]|nr:ribonuclease [Oscillospiraceae bacterium]